MRLIFLSLLVILSISLPATAQVTYTISKCELEIKPDDIPPVVHYGQAFIGGEKQYKIKVANYLKEHNIKKSKRPCFVQVAVYVDTLGNTKANLLLKPVKNEAYNKIAMAFIEGITKWEPPVKTYNDNNDTWFWTPDFYIEQIDF